LLQKEDLKEEFFKKLKSDYQTLLDLKSKWENIQEDPKLESLIQHLKQSLKENSQRKIVIFSSYSDTVNYLADKLA
jgi:ERCC4-related helicase